MPINLNELFDDLAMVHQPAEQYKNQVDIVLQLHQRLRDIGEAEKIEPELIWIAANKNENNRYAVGQFLKMLTSETGDSWGWLINQAVSAVNYFELMVESMNNKIIFYDEIPSPYEAHWVTRLKENMSEASILIVLDHSNLMDQLDGPTRSTIDHVIDVRTEKCKVLLFRSPQGL